MDKQDHSVGSEEEASAPASPRASQIIDDLDASEADEAAGHVDGGTGLLAEMDKAAAHIRTKVARRRA